MTRNELKIYAQQTYDKALSTHTFNRYERLNTCQAHYVDVGNSVILKSHNDIVAIFNKNVGTLYVFTHYSVSTDNHIAWFADMLEWDRITYLYKRFDGVLEKSRDALGGIRCFKPSKNEWQKLYDYNFSMEITSLWD